VNVTKVYHKVFDTCTRCPNCREHDEGERCHAPVEGDPRKNADRINRGWLIGEKIPDWCPLSSPGSLPAADEEALADIQKLVMEYREWHIPSKQRPADLAQSALAHLRSRLARLADAEPLIAAVEEPDKIKYQDGSGLYREWVSPEGERAILAAALRYRSKVKEEK